MANQKDSMISINELALIFDKEVDEFFDLISSDDIFLDQIEGKTVVRRKDICNWILENRISTECTLADGRKVLLEPVSLAKTDDNIFFFYLVLPDTDEGAFLEVHLSKELSETIPDLIYVYSRLKESLKNKDKLTSSYVIISGNEVIFDEIVPEVEL